MNGMDIKFGEEAIVTDDLGKVNVTWTITLTDMPANDAWHLGRTITNLCERYKQKQLAEARQIKPSSHLDAIIGEKWKVG